MLTIVAKRVQSRLSRKGLKVELKDVKTYLQNNVSNVNNITDRETNKATDYFMSTATKLTVIQEDVEPMITNESAPELEALTNNNSDELEPTQETSICVDVENGNIAELTQEELETLTSEDVDTVNRVDDVNTASIQDIDSSELYTNRPALDTEEETALATATKSELIASTANSLGVVLNTAEIELIASNFNSSSEDLTDSLEEIKSAIVAFIQYKVSLNSQKISETLEEISQVASDGFSQNSEQLTTGLQGINSQLQEQTKDFKSKVKSTLAAFKIPSLKAG
ncbi:hypothetical protein H6G54_21180 [Anabaena cylindrica FACHB-243]|uniref:Uncharacterized protein n=1 Tax=Anabaena cylindrica (strain ATCC 27899 / PCC 7122) TaxID=272123 RepID=K9ZS23_ANACC|nr:MULTISPECIES: hypothetical protein [Anabaena]AFZ61322.1 hypothetical protein Anacy_6045 [Anabaena cylindrica PCC 7122]MBD2420170.1 hypothetical protein [Anabaena cylindrica FACHB-243]MBY5282203.1 hypothetical protein [Anabaena sp. CCAP 1446/1C]MBY5309440.1 hypothetical protein [Anabaena sp. CCAP 1446/1C]MCM2409263.1 hypothetical protein [Anabaena sp. CCAP 1446/1C]